MKRILLIALVIMAASLVIPSATVNASEEQGPGTVYFEETGHYLGGDFLVFWREHGGIPTFGYPLTSEIEQDGVIVQYFERHVFEYHPDNPEDYKVLPRRLGAEARDNHELQRRANILSSVGVALRGLPGLPSGFAATFVDAAVGGERPFQADNDADGGRFFPATEQSLQGDFLEYWEEHGGTRVFGYPISSEFDDDGTLVQFMERAVFELHPDNPSEWRVLARPLGVEAAERDEVDTSPEEYDGETPLYHEDLWQTPEPLGKPSQLRIDKIGVAANFEHVGMTPAGAMEAPWGWNNVSWRESGKRPGEPGNVLVAGHLDAPGGVPAAFWNLRYLVPGDLVTVISETGDELVFEVTELQQFHVNNVPNGKLFGHTDQRNLNLITCAGAWDYSIGMYDQRLVVYTTLVSD